jgi:hypothetical protein
MTPLLEAPLDQDAARTALDELFTLAGKYNSSEAYLELMRFVGRFRFYSQCDADLHANARCALRFHCSPVAAGLSSGDQNQCPADRDLATNGTHIVCVRCERHRATTERSSPATSGGRPVSGAQRQNRRTIGANYRKCEARWRAGHRACRSEFDPKLTQPAAVIAIVTGFLWTESLWALRAGSRPCRFCRK